MIIAVEAVLVLRAGLLQRRHVGAVDEVEIRVSVSVEIKDGDAADHWFRLVLLRRRAAIA